MTTITTAARRIARAAKGQEHRGGFLCFDDEGRGGEWYSSGSRVGAEYVTVPMTFRRVTQRAAQDILDRHRELR